MLVRRKGAMNEQIERLLRDRTGIKLDIGCGETKMPGWVGMDYRQLPGVDIVHNVEQFPWPLPDECAILAMTSHLLEHINPHPGDARIQPLVELLLQKNILTQEEVREKIGEYNAQPVFMRLMDEVWRILKYDGEFVNVFPYAGSQGYWQDPTHVNGINEVTFTYFDPLDEVTGGQLYRIYKPKPWKIKYQAFQKNGFMEVALIKRREDESYK